MQPTQSDDKIDKATVFFESGDTYYESRRYDLAAEQYENGLALDRENPYYLNQLGLCKLELKLYPDALEMFSLAAKSESEIYNKEYYDINIIWTLLYLQEYAKAEGICKKFKNIDHSNSHIHYLTACALFGQRKEEQAARRLKLYIQCNDDKGKKGKKNIFYLFFTMGYIYETAEDWSPAIRAYSNALKGQLNSEDKDICISNLSNTIYKFGEELFLAGEYEHAAKHFSSALALKNDVSIYHNALGMCFHYMDAHDDALNSFMLALLIAEKTKLPELERANILVNAAKSLFYLKQYERSEKLCKQAENLGSKIFDLYFFAACSLFAQGKKDLAYNRAAPLIKDYTFNIVDILLDISKTFEDIKEPLKAIDVYEFALNLPSTPIDEKQIISKNLIRLYFLLGKEHLKAKKYLLARAYFESSIQYGNDSFRCHYMLSITCYRLKWYAHSLNHASKALDGLSPNNPRETRKIIDLLSELSLFFAWNGKILFSITAKLISLWGSQKNPSPLLIDILSNSKKNIDSSVEPPKSGMASQSFGSIASVTTSSTVSSMDYITTHSQAQSEFFKQAALNTSVKMSCISKSLMASSDM